MALNPHEKILPGIEPSWFFRHGIEPSCFFRHGIEPSPPILHSCLFISTAVLDLKLLRDVLTDSSNTILKSPKHLASQIVGRSFDILQSDKPKSMGENVYYPFMQMLVIDIQKNVENTYLPTSQASHLLPTLRKNYESVTLHMAPVTAIGVSQDGQFAASSSRDDRLVVWNVRSRSKRASVRGVGANVSAIHFAVNDGVLVTSEKNCVRLWSLSSSQQSTNTQSISCIRVISDSDDSCTVCIAQDQPFLALFYDGISRMHVWSLSNPLEPKQTLKLPCPAPPDKTFPKLHQDKSVLASISSYNFMVVWGFRGAETAYVWDMRNGSERFVLRPHKPSSTLQAVAQSPELFVLEFKCAGMGEGGGEGRGKTPCISRLDIYEATNGRLVKYIAGCPYDVGLSGCPPGSLLLSHSGSYAFSFCTIDLYDYCEFSVFNIDSSEHRHIALHAGRAGPFVGSEFNTVFSNVRGEKTIKIWNLQAALQAGKPNILPKALSFAPGAAENVPVQRRAKVVSLTQRYPTQVAVVAADASLIEIVDFNPANRFRGELVGSLEFPLNMPGEPIIFGENIVVTLNQKGVKEGMLVYQQFGVYQIQTKALIRRIKEVFIFVSAEEEYSIVDDDKLVGPVESKTHFIVWSLTTGQLMKRIKPSQTSVTMTRVTTAQALPTLAQNMIINPAGGQTGPKGQTAGAAGQSVPETEGQKSQNREPTRIQASRRSDTPSREKEREKEKESSREKRKRAAAEDSADTEKESEQLETLQIVKETAMESFLVSESRKVLVAAYSARYLHVFDLSHLEHVQTLLSSSALSLAVSALTANGQYLLHSVNQADEGSGSGSGSPGLLVWNCSEGREFKRLKRLVSLPIACALTEDARLVAFALANSSLYLWTLHHRDHFRVAQQTIHTRTANRATGEGTDLAEGADSVERAGTFVQRFLPYEGFRTGLVSENYRVSMRFILNAELLLVVCRDGVTVWNTGSLEMTSAFSPDFQVHDVLPLMDGTLLLYANKDQSTVSSMRFQQSQRAPEPDPKAADRWGPKASRLFPSKSLQAMTSGRDRESEENVREQNLRAKLEKLREKF